MYGQALVDYELEIAKKEGITAEELNDPENAYWDKTANIDATTADQADLAVKIDMTDFIGGDNWFIRRVTLKASAAAVGMTGAGYASYDAAVEMDRRDRRLLETVRDGSDPDNGLWVRIHHGRSGAENQYRWDRTGVTIGFDRAFSEKSRAGAWFSYTEGDTEFLDVRGDGDMKRYEFALFDTLTHGNHYFDFVARFGRVSSEYSVGNDAYTTNGDYDQDYAALSAEYGYTLKSETGVFVEPQAQFQLTYLDSFDYRARGMKVEAESETSAIGRLASAPVVSSTRSTTQVRSTSAATCCTSSQMVRMPHSPTENTFWIKTGVIQELGPTSALAPCGTGRITSNSSLMRSVSLVARRQTPGSSRVA